MNHETEKLAGAHPCQGSPSGPYERYRASAPIIGYPKYPQRHSISRLSIQLRAFGLALLLSFAYLSKPVMADSVVRSIPVGRRPTAIAVDPVSRMVYVVNASDNSVTVINGLAINGLLTIPVVKTIAVGKFPNAVAVNPELSRAYVTNGGSGDVTVIDGNNNNVIATLNAVKAPSVIAVNPLTSMVYVGNAGRNTVTVIDGRNN